MKQKIIARYWVLQTGRDCDGYNSGRITPFTTRENAQNYAHESNEWSDGMGYFVTDSWDIVKSYCEDYSLLAPEFAIREIFARRCSATLEGMDSGWVVNDGDEYFKYEKDAVKWCRENGYSSLKDAYKSNVIYYTEWEDWGDYEWELIDGKLVEL